MLTIQIVCIGKLKEEYLKQAVMEYSKRLSKYCKLEIIELIDEKIPNKISAKMEQEIKEKECKQFIQQLKKDSYLLALDLKGKEMSSEDFSEKIENLSIQTSHITFLIGGSLGLSNSLLSMVNEKICFSKMTFPHQLIRVFLLEQLFRGFKISRGETYHR